MNSTPEPPLKPPQTPNNNKASNSAFATPKTPGVGRHSKELTIPPSPFMKKLGYGTGVQVYLLERPKHSPWAVKKMMSKITPCHEMAQERLKNEANILKEMKHPNIVGFRAWTKSADGTMCLAMENGEKSLMDLIEERHEKEQGPFPAKSILNVATDIANALQYIHSKKHILHGDLKSANVLIVGDFEAAKLCDFGVCIPLDENLDANENAAYVGTECWSAPEALAETRISHKTDMFAFGLLLWEMISLSVPHADRLEIPESEEGNMQLDDSVPEEYLESLGTRPALPEGDYLNDPAYTLVLMLFACCTDSNPELRPSGKAVLDLLSQSQNGTSS